MNYKNVIVMIAVIFITACNNSQSSETVIDSGVTNLNAIITELPDKPGYASFKQNCMQPWC